MGFGSRKFYVWLISLGAVLAIYLLYSQLSKTPQIDIGTAANLKGPVAEGDMDQSQRAETGMIGNVGVGAVQKAKYIHLNNQKQVDREFGFEKLLAESGDEWEIEKPYMNIFRHNFKCYITADRGKVRVETAVGRTSPKDATLIGNVVIHILPEGDGNTKESFIYLDYVDFISEKSQFSTAGPVKFISQNARMLGTGLELIYDDELDRLEFLRVIHLESLRLKASRVKRSDGKTAEERSEGKPSNRQATKPSGYRCLFSKNVAIDTGEQLVFADEVSINNIPWPKGSSKKSNKADVGGTDSAKAHNVTVSKPSEPNKSPEQFIDIVVTCDNGFVVTPMDSPRATNKLGRKAAATDGKRTRNFDDTNGRTTLVARRIDYCAATEKVILEGDCSGTMLREDSGIQQKYTLSAPKLTVKLSRDKDKRSSILGTGIEHLTADGGVVQLATVKTAGEKLLGGIELKCRKFDVDSNQQMFLATGPGVIKVDNSSISEPEAEVGRFSLRRRCYAFLRNFDTLKYLLEANQIIADNKRERILIDYFPIVQGQHGQQVAVTAGHIEANLVETADGQTELATLAATGGVSYEEQDTQFEGSQFFYDANSAIITAAGDELQPCYFNGTLVDGIEYDLETSRVKTKIAGPGELQMKR